MINTIRYAGKGQIEKDGKRIEIDVPGPAILTRMGAFIPVIITHPQIVQEALQKENKPIPAVNVRALIDTGASSSVITPAVADTLGLVHTGFQKVSSVQDEQERPVFFGAIRFSWGRGKEIPLVSCPLKNLECLIGRDILMHWHFTYNGTDGSIVICD